MCLCAVPDQSRGCERYDAPMPTEAYRSLSAEESMFMDENDPSVDRGSSAPTFTAERGRVGRKEGRKVKEGIMEGMKE